VASGPLPLAAGGHRRAYDRIRHDQAGFESYLSCYQSGHTARVVNGRPQPLGPEQVGKTINSFGATTGDVDCLHAAGYETPAPPRPFVPMCVMKNDARTVATGRVAGGTWRYDVFPGHDPALATCTELVLDGRVVDAGEAPLLPLLYRIPGSDTHLLVFVVRDPTVDHVVLTMDGTEQQLRAVLIPGTMEFVFAAAVVPHGDSVDVERVDYDAAGNVLNRVHQPVGVPR
jgi:hypothetical protein